MIQLKMEESFCLRILFKLNIKKKILLNIYLFKNVLLSTTLFLL